MKKFLAVFILLALTGCFGQQEEVQQPTNVEVNADSILDSQIYASAVQTNDAKQCATIKDTTKKDECEKVVGANLLTQKAVANADDDFCDEIELERYKENCTLAVQQPSEKSDGEIMNKIKTLESEALKSKDLTICDKIEYENLKQQCKVNVITSIATSEKDDDLCLQIEGNDQLIQACKTAVELSKDSTKPKESDKTQDR